MQGRVTEKKNPAKEKWREKIQQIELQTVGEGHFGSHLYYSYNFFVLV